MSDTNTIATISGKVDEKDDKMGREKSPSFAKIATIDGTEGTYRTRFFTQYIAAIVTYFGPIAFGCVVGYSSPVIDDLTKHNRFVQFTTSEKSYFGSLMTIGALVGGLLAGPLVDYLGRKFCIFLTCVPYVLGWLLIIYSNQVSEYIPLIYAGRVITGICTGIISMASPVYLSELASPEIRGTLGSGFQLFVNVGVLLAFVVGAYVPWTYLALVSCLVPIILMICIIPMPESPAWLLRQKRTAEALDALRWLRGDNANIQEECDIMRKSLQQESKIFLSDFKRPDLLKPFKLMIMEMFFQQLSGINAVVFNASAIFTSATDSLEPNQASIIVAAVMVFATFFSSYFMDKAGRRVLLLISAGCMAVSTIVLGGYYYAKDVDPNNTESIGWLPVLCLVVFVFTFNLGFGPVPWLMMGEVFPAQARGMASSVITAINWTFAFVVTMSFEGLREGIKDHGVFWLFGVVCILAVLYVWKFVPETKGKSLEQIQREFLGTNALDEPTDSMLRDSTDSKICETGNAKNEYSENLRL